MCAIILGAYTEMQGCCKAVTDCPVLLIFVSGPREGKASQKDSDESMIVVNFGAKGAVGSQVHAFIFTSSSLAYVHAAHTLNKS